MRKVLRKPLFEFECSRCGRKTETEDGFGPEDWHVFSVQTQPMGKHSHMLHGGHSKRISKHRPRSFRAEFCGDCSRFAIGDFENDRSGYEDESYGIITEGEPGIIPFD